MPYKNLDKALMFLRNQVFCLNIWNLWRDPTILQFNIFCWNFAHVFYLPLSTKECVGFFKFYLDLELFAKIKKDLVSSHSFFTLTNNSRSKQNKKYPTHHVCKVSAKNIKISGSWSSSKFSILQTKNLVSLKQ